MNQKPRSAASSARDLTVSAGNTAPVGFPGVLTKIAFVLEVTCAATSAAEGRKPLARSSR